MTLTFQTLPPSTNHLYQRSGRGVFMLPKVREAKEAIAWEARSQYRGEPLDGPVRLKIAFHWPDARRRDWDNNKVLYDACTGILWKDDSQIFEVHLTKGIDRERPRVEMTVEAIDAKSVPKRKEAADGSP
jgi:Holliday junction resolvase RusA-like endonuclease